MTERLTLHAVAAKPELATTTLTLAWGESVVFRPLVPKDVAGLADFLSDLSPRTREFFTSSGHDLAAAQELCDAIARYDKLRLVAVVGGRIVALMEFSFAIVERDRDRYHGYGIRLAEGTDCRFGPCIADDYQNRGLGTVLLPLVKDVARRFGIRRIILWGGVFAHNLQAVRYYRKNGFQTMGAFKDDQGKEVLDMMLVL